VVSAHAYNFERRLKRAPRASRYSNGIFFQTFTRDEFQAELQAVFARVAVSAICLWVPLLSRFHAFHFHAATLFRHLPGAHVVGKFLVAMVTRT
jgi:hypothetical protein